MDITFRPALLFISAIAVAGCTPDSDNMPPSPSPADYLNESREHSDARMQWWRDARFGMFVHWGAYAVPAGVHNGKEIGSIGEWIMNTASIPELTSLPGKQLALQSVRPPDDTVVFVLGFETPLNWTYSEVGGFEIDLPQALP